MDQRSQQSLSCKVLSKQQSGAKNEAMVGRRTTVTVTDITSDFRRRNHIYSGYRLETKSTPESLKTWFAIHNETGNIWTHLLSAIYYIYVLAQVALTTEENHKAWDKFFLALQAFGGIVVFGCSTGFHTMENHCSSQKWYFLDIFGQVFAICSAFASLLYFTFWNEPQLQQIYLGLFVIAFSTTLYILFKKTDSFLQWKELWLSGWIGAVLIPLAHAVCLESDHGVTAGHLPLFVAGMLMAATGALLYITALPEAWFPGQFDIWGHSHQLWHICIFLFTVIDIHVTSDMANQRINLVTE